MDTFIEHLLSAGPWVGLGIGNQPTFSSLPRSRLLSSTKLALRARACSRKEKIRRLVLLCTQRK